MNFKYGRGRVRSLRLGSVDINLETINVRVGERRLRAVWTREQFQDIQAFHNIDAEAELARLIDDEILRSLMRDIINQKTKKFKFGR